MLLAPARLKDHWREQRLFLVRSTVGGSLMLVLTLMVVARLVDLQVLRYEHFSDLSRGNRVRIEALPPMSTICSARRVSLSTSRDAAIPSTATILL